MVRFFYLASMIVVGLFFLASLYIVIGSCVGFRAARFRAAKLSCPNCNRPIGNSAVKVASNLQHKLCGEYIKRLNLQDNECVDIHFRILLPAVCPHCHAEHEYDLDELGIGPV